MIRPRTLVLSGSTHQRLRSHLFPGDGKEAAAILLCSRTECEGLKLLVRNVIEVPHQRCQRTPVSLSWPGDYLDRALLSAETDDLSILLIHSHPSGLFDFSQVDDVSDQAAVQSLVMAGPTDRVKHQPWHGSAIMVPDGTIRARVYDNTMYAHDVDLVAAYGDDLRFYWGNDRQQKPPAMAFGDSMGNELAKLSMAVVGVSGTGSVVAEQLMRMGTGELIVVDFDCVEEKNLNRILNTTQSDADANALKVDVFKRAAAQAHPCTRVKVIPQDICERVAIEAVAEADIVFCCVDSLEARHICDRLAAATLQPLFDVGVSIPVRTPARGMVISNVSGRVNYVQPGSSTLADRGIYTPELLAAEYLREVDPEGYADRVEEGYMPGAGQEAPSVICVNMYAASTMVLEFLARAFPFRLDGNYKFANAEFDLASESRSHTPDMVLESSMTALLGAGLRRPLLGLPGLEKPL